MFAVLAVLLTTAFAGPLWDLVKLALKTEIQSHILLIPFIFVYLWKTSNTADPKSRSGIVHSDWRSAGHDSALAFSLPASLAALCALGALGAYWYLGRSGRIPDIDALSLAIGSYLGFLLAGAVATLGGQVLRSRLFPVVFLVFMIPIPVELSDFMSVGLQKLSAEAAEWMLSLTGMPTLREGMRFQFPGLAIVVAEECSGLRSTFVLFITSLLAGHLFLRTGWKKAVLAFSIFPLGILRNGFRVTVISWLTVNVDPGIIDGPLHHRGGPVFFVLSLLPLFALLWVLRRSDFRRNEDVSSTLAWKAPES